MPSAVRMSHRDPFRCYPHALSFAKYYHLRRKAAFAQRPIRRLSLKFPPRPYLVVDTNVHRRPKSHRAVRQSNVQAVMLHLPHEREANGGYFVVIFRMGRVVVRFRREIPQGCGELETPRQPDVLCAA